MSDDSEVPPDAEECRIGNYILLDILGRDSTCIILEYAAGGHLQDYITKSGHIPEAEARTMFRQLVSAVHYCHQQGIVHRDIKPENILLDANKNIKITDFGLSVAFDEEKINTFHGTMAYMPPEAVTFTPYYGPTVDTWSLGVTLYVMVTGEMPFKGRSYFEMQQLITNGKFTEPSYISEECLTLLHKLLTVNSDERPTLEEIMKDPWVNKDQDEELRPYIEPAWGDLDPQVTEDMEKLGFDTQEIQESVNNKKLNDIMGTYMLLVENKKKMKGRKIRVRPCPSSDLNCSATSSHEVLPSGHNNQDPACLLASLTAKPPPLPHSAEAKNNTPPLSPESSTAAPCPPVQHGPGDAHTNPSSGNPSSSVAAGKEATDNNSLQAGHLHDGVPASSPGHSLGWQGLARRVIQFFLKCSCIRPSKKKDLKTNKVKPV
ncbi:serine/threonine-protein kinase MARK2-like [Molossus molossus]|uniref:serine/threonine-protein kinase MARK2-like n=1 Tax=Molossus molossus TaxID=27622 RepID=UPI0017472B2C|nr:serine/threonine-protein kinase MARK2-like [Molossus molossus]